MAAIMQRVQNLRDHSAICRGDQAFQGTALLLAAMLVFVGVLDVISTNAALALGNTEANPVVAAFQSYWGVWWFVPKLSIHIALAMVVLWLPSRRMTCGRSSPFCSWSPLRRCSSCWFEFPRGRVRWVRA